MTGAHVEYLREKMANLALRRVHKQANRIVGRYDRRWRINGALYVIRDLYKGRQFISCEYAVRNPNGSKKWLPCVEGVEFVAIKPLRVRAHG